MWAELAGGLLGGGLGGLLGGGKKQPDIGEQITQLVNRMNDTLSQHMEKARNANQQGTRQAKKTIEDYLGQARMDLSKYLLQAKQDAASNMWGGYQTAKAYNAPAMYAGNQALGAYMDTLGLSRPTAGFNAMQSALVNDADRQLMQSMFMSAAPEQGDLSNPVMDPGAGPELLRVNDQTTKDWIKNNGITNAGFVNWVKQNYGSGVANDVNRYGTGLAGNTGLVQQYLHNVVFPQANQSKTAQFQQQKAAYDAYQQQVAKQAQYNQYQQQVQQRMQGIPVDQSMINLYRNGGLF